MTSDSETRLVEAIFITSMTLAGVSFGLLAALLSLATLGELSGRGERGIRFVRLGSRLMLLVACIAVLVGGLCYIHLAGWADTYRVVVIGFPAMLLTLLLSAVAATLLSE